MGLVVNGVGEDVNETTVGVGVAPFQGIADTTARNGAMRTVY